MLVYRSNRLKGAAAVVLCAALAWAATFMAAERPLMGWAGAVFFGGLGLLALAGVLTGGSTLRVGRKGFEIGSIFKRTRFRWDEIEPLELAEVKHSRVIALRYLPGSGKPGVSRVMTGMDAFIPNAYDVPLQALCDTLNEWRARYLGANPARTASLPQAPAAESGTGAQEAPVVRLAFGAAFLVLVLNAVVRLALKLQGMPVTMAIAFGVAGLVALWFLKYARRSPTARERSRFLWIYSGLVVVPTVALFVMASSGRAFNGWVWAILAMHCLPYPAAAQLFLSEKRLGRLAPRQA